MDRNQATGLLLISILLIGYLYFFSDSGEQSQETQQTEQVEKSQETKGPEADKAETDPEPEKKEFRDLVDSSYSYFDLMQGEAEDHILENKELEIVFSSRGGRIKKVTLKNHKTWDKKPLVLLDEESSQMKLFGMGKSSNSISQSLKAQPFDLYEFIYDAKVEVLRNEKDTSRVITFKTEYQGQPVIQRYELKNGSFELEYFVDPGPFGSLAEGGLNFQWINRIKRFEKTLDQSRNQTSLNYLNTEGDVISVSNDNDPEPESEEVTGVKWFSMKQRFFNAGLISPGFMKQSIFSSEFDPLDSSIVKFQRADVMIPMDLMGDKEKPFRFYLGPNNYQVLKKVDQGYGENVYLGWTIFASVNKYTVVPFFNFLENYISNYGLLIFILVIVVKIILFPLSYKSYTSMARMKVLRPEIEEIKERIGDDQQKVQMETMKLYQKFGVNPLSGCVPVALQIPVLFALFNFFPNSIELRQQSFLWADDLSTYDSILDLPFNIPFYGDHVSLFTLLMTISTIAYTYVQNQGNPMQQQGPMKTMQYFFPIMIMFFLNNFSSGLTYYYFLSNIVTIAQQFIIRKFTDDSDIRAKLEAKQARKKKKGKSGFAQKLEKAMSDRVEGQNRAMRRQIDKKK